jgi:hypothetical protein
VTTFCLGIGATLAWQSYGDAARQMIVESYPQFGWLAPRAAAAPAPAAAAHARSPESQELQELSASLAAVRQRVDQLSLQFVAGQEQVTRDLAARVQATERSILDKITAAQPKPEVTAARRPAQTPTPQTQSQLR